MSMANSEFGSLLRIHGHCDAWLLLLEIHLQPKIGILNEQSRVNLTFLSPASPFLVPLLPFSTFASYHVTQIFAKPIIALILLLLRFV